MVGNANSGRPGGNPNIANERKTGPRTKEGKFINVVKRNVFKPNSSSKLLKYFRKCNNCPLRPKEYNTVDKNGNNIIVKLPAKCNSYRVDGKCLIQQADYLMQVKTYYEIGEEMDTMALQNHLTYKMLENAEIAKEAEMLEKRRPGFYSSRFQELASKNLESVNKLKYGELNRNENVNVNVDLTDTIVSAYEARQNEEKEKNKKKKSIETEARHDASKNE